MIKNMGIVDRVLRVVLAVVVGALILSGQIGGWVAVLLGILAVVFLATSAVGTCPLYMPFHASTRADDHPAPTT